MTGACLEALRPEHVTRSQAMDSPKPRNLRLHGFNQSACGGAAKIPDSIGSSAVEFNLRRAALPYFAVGSFFTLLSMNSNQNPWGSGVNIERVVGPMKTGASDLLSVCILAALIRGIITSSSLAMNRKCAAPGS